MFRDAAQDRGFLAKAEGSSRKPARAKPALTDRLDEEAVR